MVVALNWRAVDASSLKTLIYHVCQAMIVNTAGKYIAAHLLSGIVLVKSATVRRLIYSTRWRDIGHNEQREGRETWFESAIGNG